MGTEWNFDRCSLLSRAFSVPGPFVVKLRRRLHQGLLPENDAACHVHIFDFFFFDGAC